MTKTKLIEALAYECGLTKAESKKIVGKMFSLMTDALVSEDDVTITDFASFRVKDRPAKRYRNSTTGKMMEITAGKRVKVKISDRIMKVIDPSFNLENSVVED